MTQIVNTVYYKLQLVINLGNNSTGGTILIDTYTFDPNLKKGDTIHIEDWKVGFSTPTQMGNHVFEFDATVIDIKKIVARHQHLTVNILLESPDREKIAQIRDALKSQNPESLG
jgi:hypothetical protein